MSVFAPVAALVFIILFDLLWLFRVTYFVSHLLSSLAKHRRALVTDWQSKAQALPRFHDLYHVIFLPNYREDVGIIRTTMKSLVASAYPGRKERFVVVLGGEERERDAFLGRAAAIEREFGGEFLKLLVTVHPKDLPGELAGKGANVHWMGRRATEFIDSLGVPYEDVIVSSFDVDTCVHPQYFASLAYTYLTVPNATRSSYQPIALYNNNMWDSPAPVRVAAFGTSFWLMTELARPERLSTFSSHSMPLRALVDVGFWQKDIVTEDSRIFLQCLVHYDGDYRVTPLYVPVSMDTVVGDTWGQSLVNLYKQQRRWAWGVEHFPYLVSRFWHNPRFPLSKKIFYIWTLGEGMYTWATAPLIIFILGYMPFWFAPEAIRGSVLYQNTPHTLEWLMRLAMVGAFVSVFASLAIMPPRPAHKPARYGIVMLLQWLLVPVTFVVFGAFPAIDAQTRLMLGKYLGFNVTAKRKSS
jgi:cellulose synthase/poly-beta-1,6-N-acetylglucosamine synthase-like glycosyltransferase